MEKRDFLKKLHKSLRRTFTKQEIRDILTDYESFFISGANDGKSENEICTELGDPDAVALELVKELPRNNTVSPPINIFIKIIAALLTLFGFSYSLLIYPGFNLVRDSLVLFCVFAAVLFLALIGKRNIHKSGKAYVLILSFGNVLLFGIVILIDTFIKELIYVTANILPLKPNSIMSKIIDFFKFADIEFLTNFMSAIVYISAAIFFLISVTAVLGFYRSTPFYFAMLIHAAGALNYIGSVYNILNDMQTIEHFINDMNSALKIYFASIALALIFMPIIHIQSEKLPQVNRPSPLPLKNIFIGILSAALTFGVFFYFYIVFAWYNPIRENIVLFGVIPVILILALVWKRKSIPQIPLKPIKIHKFILPIGYILLFLIGAIMYVFIKKSLNYALSSPPLIPNNIIDTIVFNITDRFKDIEAYLNFLGNLVDASTIITIVITVAAVYGFYRSTPLYSIMIIQAVGVINLIGRICDIVGDMADMTKFNLAMDDILKFYFISIALTIIFIPITYILSRKVKK